MQDRYRERENRGTSDPIPLSSVVCWIQRGEQKVVSQIKYFYTWLPQLSLKQTQSTQLRIHGPWPGAMVPLKR
jgi:hypothetical protein